MALKVFVTYQLSEFVVYCALRNFTEQFRTLTGRGEGQLSDFLVIWLNDLIDKAVCESLFSGHKVVPIIN